MKINCRFTTRILTQFISRELEKFTISKGILGLSGGLDSTVTAFLATHALGKENLVGLIMPYGESFTRDIEDAGKVADVLGIETRIIDIAPAVDSYFERYPTQEKLLIGNKMARERMSILYDFSARLGALILGTSNKTELLIGYGTIHGDMACALNPIGDLYKTQVRMLGRYLKIPEIILTKEPTAGLWLGQTDEGEIGLKYEELDQILYLLVDQTKPASEVEAAGFSREKIDRIIHMIKSSQFKRMMPPIAKLSGRTVGHDFLFPYDWGK
jgi:NAD+ synthase